MLSDHLGSRLVKNTLKVLIAFVALCILSVASILTYLFWMPSASVSHENVVSRIETDDLSIRLRSHVDVLATEIGERNARTDIVKLDEAANYISDNLAASGYSVIETTFGEQSFRNVSAEIKGVTTPEEIIVLSAHYDTAIRTAGADDDASGVAAVLEIAKLLHGHEFDRTIRFILFPNEEKPFGVGELKGSYVSARNSFEQGENIVAMYSLEMLGYFSDAKDSQSYPYYLRGLFPTQGNFIIFGSNIPSRSLLHDSIKFFRNQKLFPSEGMALPASLIGRIQGNDAAAYWQFGYPAVLITDGGEYRNPNYHRASDLPDSLDYQSMAQITLGIHGILTNLARKH